MAIGPVAAGLRLRPVMPKALALFAVSFVTLAVAAGCVAPPAGGEDEDADTSTDAVSISNPVTGKRAIEDAVLGSTLTFERSLALGRDPLEPGLFGKIGKASLDAPIRFANKQWDVMSCDFVQPVGDAGTAAVRIEDGDAFTIAGVSNVGVSGEYAYLSFDLAFEETTWIGRGKPVTLYARKCQLFQRTQMSVFDARVK